MLLVPLLFVLNISGSHCKGDGEIFGSDDAPYGELNRPSFFISPLCLSHSSFAFEEDFRTAAEGGNVLEEHWLFEGQRVVADTG